MDSPDVNGTLTFFSTALEAGRVVLGKDAKALFKTFVLLEVVFAGIYIAIGGSADLRAIAKKILVIGFFSYVIANYSELLSIVLDGFVSSGAKAAGASGSSIGSMKDPAGIFVLGCQKIKPLLDKEGQGDWFSFSLTSILFFVLGVISTLAYGLMAMQVFVTYLEYQLVAAMGFILIPFGIFKPLSFLAEKTFGAIIGFGIKFMTLSLIIGISQKYLDTVTLSSDITLQQAFDFLVVSMSLCFLAFHTPGLALTLLSGSPHVSVGTVAATAAGTGQTAKILAGSPPVRAGAAVGSAATVAAARGGYRAAKAGGNAVMSGARKVLGKLKTNMGA